MRMLESGRLIVHKHEHRKPDYGFRQRGRPGRRTAQQARALADKIAELAAEGYIHAEIAAQLGVSATTVSRHRRGLCKAAKKR